MGKKLAIQGHLTRGNEVIKLLEMMGGVPAATKGFRESYCYYISSDTATKYISWDYIGPEEIDKYKIFTLEEFLEKYPFKVGDKVVDGCGDSLTIKSMAWSEDCETIVYDFKDSAIVLAAEDLLKYNAGDKFPSFEPTFKINGEIEYKIPDGYEITEVSKNKVFIKPIKSKYPTEYEECVRIAKNIHGYDIHVDAPAYGELMEAFVKLLICRDAYWKIAGEEMGLGKPWEPNEDSIIAQYGIRPLLFPSKEIYNMFYDNFKDLIEQCKELL